MILTILSIVIISVIFLVLSEATERAGRRLRRRLPPRELTKRD